jgi:dimethylpropiothetin dethiomethylase
MADALVTLLHSMAASLRQSDLPICQDIALALDDSVGRAELAAAPAPTGITAAIFDDINRQLAHNQPDLFLHIRQAMPGLTWRHPGFGRVPDHIAAGMAVCEIIGPTGQITHDRIRAGLLFQASGMTYPRHSHAAEEIYLLLSGPVDWQVDDAGWYQRQAGEFIHHLPYQPHATCTGETALLAIWGWAGDIAADSYKI